MTRIEVIEPKPLDRAFAIQATLYYSDRLRALLAKGDFRGAVAPSEILHAHVKVFAIYDDRAKYPIRVEYPE